MRWWNFRVGMPRQIKFKIAYLSGPVNAIDVHKIWSTGRQQPYLGTSYLSQYFQICSELDAEGYVVTILPGKAYRTQCGKFLVENRPPPERLSGASYHLGIALWFVRWFPRLLAFRPNVLIVTAFQNHWFSLFYLKWFGVTAIPALHCVFWPVFVPMRWYWQILDWLNRNLFWRQVPGAIAASEPILRQVQKMTGVPTRVFLPTYARGQFDQVAPPPPDRPFRVFFAGRMVENKGVYDLLAIAERLEEGRPGEFWFDVCGDGPELDRMRARPLPKCFRLHGFCSPPKLLSILGDAHVVIVPTRTTFEEGFNMVCAEAILAGRPVITSAVCPALATMREAAVEVAPDDVDGYYRVILRLRDDPAFYEQKRRACGPLQAQFYDANNSWGAHLMAVLKDCGIMDEGALYDARHPRRQ